MKSPIVFVVEDNLVYQSLIIRAIEPISKSICSYTTGENCLDEMHKDPSIIIMDYELAGEMTGLEAIRKIRTISPNIQVILFTTQTDLYTKENLYKYGSFEYLEKNHYSFSVLTQMVHSIASKN